MVIKGVIFDLDGTLLDTENISTEALDAVLQQHGDYKVTWEVKEKIIGMRDLDCMLCSHCSLVK
jgi:beta-phosphoglucomutase-like phosphatase (HAD superfamily)